jgi:hypothetical protein
MSAHVIASTVLHLPKADDDTFLRNAAEQLARLRTESEWRGYGLLASLIAIAEGEAEDGLRTESKNRGILGRSEEPDDGAEEMAQKLAHRERKRA